MSDLYSELLVKKKQTAKDMVVKYGLIVLTVIMAIAVSYTHLTLPTILRV